MLRISTFILVLCLGGWISYAEGAHNDLTGVNTYNNSNSFRLRSLRAKRGVFYDVEPEFIEEPPPLSVVSRTTTQKVPTTTIPSMGVPLQGYVDWIPTTKDEAHKLAPRAVEVGRAGGLTGSPLWAIRAVINNELTPGKFILDEKKVQIGWDGKEHTANNFEVLCMSKMNIGWARMKNGEFPNDAVIGGRTIPGELIYVGRVNQLGVLTPGKISSSRKVLYTVQEGREIQHEEYEILYVNKLKDQPYTEWIPVKRGDKYAEKVQHRAVEVTRITDTAWWPVRAVIDGDLVPGKFESKWGGAWVGRAQKEHFVDNFEILCMDRRNIAWVKMKNGEVPLDAVIGGQTIADKEWLYIGRAVYKGDLTPGKIFPSKKLMYTTWGFNEKQHAEYEALYINTEKNQRHVDWVATHRRDAHKLAGRAAEVGSEGGGAAWAIRTTINGELTPGKFLTATNQSYIPNAGKVYAAEEFEVLCMDQANIGWRKFENGLVHSDAVIGGHTASGELTFIGRVTLSKALVPGKISTSRKAIYVGNGGTEDKFTEYDSMYIIYS